MEGLDFNQRIKYDFLLLQMGEDGWAGSQLVSCSVCGLAARPNKVFVITERLWEHKQKDKVTGGKRAT